MNSVRKMIFGTIILFFVVLGFWLSIIYISSCGMTLTCYQAEPKGDRTPIPTLIPATLSAPRLVHLVPAVTPDDNVVADIARPSNPGGPGAAIGLTGNVDSGKQIFQTYCARCHGAEGVGGNLNPGTEDGTIPALNPIDGTLVSSDYQTFATNLDLFIEHGSTPAGTIPNFYMPAWGDRGALKPQEIADVIAYIISLNKK